MDNRVRWGVIGCGDVVERKSGPALKSVKRSELVAVMRRSGDQARDFAQRHEVPFWTTDAEELIGNPQVDAVYVATPPRYHLEYALRVCAAGKPCLIEKPMGRCGEEARRITQIFAEKKVPLFVAFYRRALAKFTKVKEILDSGQLGQIVSIQYFYAAPPKGGWRVVPRESGGGLFVDLGCHVIDLLHYWFGPLEFLGGDAVSHSLTHDAEDAVALAFRTRDGVLGTAVFNFLCRTRSEQLEIVGQYGRLRTTCLDCFSPLTVEMFKKSKQKSNFTRIWGKLRGRGSQDEATREYRFETLSHVHAPLIQSVVNSLLDGTVCDTTGDVALNTWDLMDAVLWQYYGGRLGAFWERVSPNDKFVITSLGSEHDSILADEYRLSEEEVQSFHDRGFLGPFKCESPLLSRIRIENSNVQDRHLEDPVLLKMCGHPSITRRVAQLLGSDNVKLFKTKFWVKHPDGQKVVPWHQDIGPNNGGLLEDGRPIPTITAWLALDDVRLESGGMRAVPGSHKRLFGDWQKNIKANLESSSALTDVELDAAVPFEARPGEFFLFHSWILHASGPNTSKGRRAALNMRFVAEGNEVDPQFRYISFPSGVVTEHHS